MKALNKTDHPLYKVPFQWQALQESVNGGRWAQARRQAEELSALAPENTQILLALGGICARSGDWKGAAEGYRRVLALEPGHWAARTDLGKVLAQLGEKEAAVALFTELIRENPQDQDVAGMLRALGKDPAALILPRG